MTERFISEQSTTVQAAIKLLGRRVRKIAGAPIAVGDGVVIANAVHSSGIVDVVCPCCRQPAGMYSALDLEIAP